MRIHSDRLTRADIFAAAVRCGDPDNDHGVYLEPAPTVHGSRSREFAHEARLASWRDSGHWRNTGKYGAERVRAASWDEWGRFLAYLFRIDPAAHCWTYVDADDFHRKTEGKFRV